MSRSPGSAFSVDVFRSPGYPPADLLVPWEGDGRGEWPALAPFDLPDDKYQMLRSAARATSYGRRMQESDFDDCFHDSLARVMDRPPRGGEVVLRAYFLKTFYRRFLDRQKVKHREIPTADIAVVQSSGPDIAAVLKVVRYALALAVLDGSIDRAHARAWWLMKYGDLDAPRIGALCDLEASRGAIYTIISRAGRKLLELYRERGYATMLEVLDHARDLADDLKQEALVHADADGLRSVLQEVLPVPCPGKERP